MTAKTLSPLDASALGLSCACLVHCLALPILSAMSPLIGVFAEQEWLHAAFVLAALPVSGFAMWRSIQSARSWGFVALALVGLALLGAGAFVESFEAHETTLTVAGALTLASAHLWRWWRSLAAAQPVESR